VTLQDNRSGENAEENLPPVLLTLGIDSDIHRMIDLAVALASSSHRQLHGYFVEDIDLLQVAELPFTTETTLTTAQTMLFDAHRLQRGLRRLANQFQDYLASAAEESGISWRYTLARGRVGELGLQARNKAEFIILEQSLPLREEQFKRMGLTRILLLDDNNPNIERALETVLRLAGHTPVEVTRIGRQSEYGNVDNLRLRYVDGSPVIVWKTISGSRLDKLLESSVLPFDTIIIPQQISAEQLREILQKADCPIVLVR
jgi:hypothetical protein